MKRAGLALDRYKGIRNSIEEEREAFIAERSTREVEKLIFIDESGIQLGMTPIMREHPPVNAHREPSPRLVAKISHSLAR